MDSASLPPPPQEAEATYTMRLPGALREVCLGNTLLDVRVSVCTQSLRGGGL